ncbi:MAG: hypothetical protein ACRC8B_07440 [Aeromonas sobria]|uniref:hypothetical protein n=1 Tax=Aeromonas sobria TaxID=646 RepID=UPI003F3D5C5C
MLRSGSSLILIAILAALMALVIHYMMTFVCGAVAGTQGLKAIELTPALNGIKI